MLLVVGTICPQADKAAEARHDGRDDPIVGEDELDFLARGAALSGGPGVQLAKRGGEAGLELAPTLDGT